MPDKPVPAVPSLAPGTPVEVLNHFNGSWIGGFQVASAKGGSYQLRRCADWYVLPEFIPEGDVREAL